MSRGRALIVEDSATARIILTRLLERADVAAIGVATAEAALPLLKQDVFNVVFMDHLLPGMNGLQALAEIKRHPETRDIPVFMYTSQSAERYLQEAKALGASGVIRKQVDRHQLLHALDTIFTRQDALPATADPVATQEPALTIPMPEDSNHSWSGRLATLEVAYEETDDALAQLRRAMLSLELRHQQQIQQLQRRHRRLALYGSLAFVLVLVLSFWHYQALTDLGQRLDSQVALIHRILGGVLEWMNGAR